MLLALIALVAPGRAPGEQASEPSSPAPARLDAGASFSCAILTGSQVRCWGYGGEGELGYPGVTTVGAVDTPALVGPLDLGAGRTAVAISSGDFHSCAILDDATVRCWGYGGDGRLGYGNTNNVGDAQTPGAAGPVDLGPGRTARAISAGGGHTCAILDDGSVRCWGFGGAGQLGYGNPLSVGDRRTPGSAGPVNLGPGRTATAISAGESQTCAILDNGSVLCWGAGASGQLGYGNQADVGDDPLNIPAVVGPVDLGAGRTAVAISAGDLHTCAILDDGTVRCWGYGGDGRLGYGNTNTLGATPSTTPAALGQVDLGAGRTAVAISAGHRGSCAILDDGSVRCWGYGGDGQLGYGNTSNVADLPGNTPGSAGPVNLGAGRTAAAISAGGRHTCARLDNGSLRCWGYGANGRLGYCSQSNVGDTAATTPNTVGPVNLVPGDGGELCPPVIPVSLTPPTISGHAPPTAVSDAVRARGFRRCLASVSARAKRARALIHRRSARKRAQARRRLARELAGGQRRCTKVYGRTPGPVTALGALARGSTEIELDFAAAGTNGNNPPAARSYLVKQSPYPIRDRHDFAIASTLCRTACRFTVTQVGTNVALVITALHPNTTYYYSIAALDNVTGRLGPRSPAVMAETA